MSLHSSFAFGYVSAQALHPASTLCWSCLLVSFFLSCVVLANKFYLILFDLLNEYFKLSEEAI